MSATMANVPVHHIMTTGPVAVRPDTPVGELLALFERHDFNALPVTDETATLLGIVTKLDLLRVLRPDAAGRFPDGAEVAAMRTVEVMRPGVLSLEGAQPVAVAADLMVETGLRSLPVVVRGGGRPTLVGMVSRGDVLRGLRQELQVSMPPPA